MSAVGNEVFVTGYIAEMASVEKGGMVRGAVEISSVASDEIVVDLI